ncbi:nickel/cobalt transporter [Serratia microhaemolytica]|uniref:nickel/cobalt transporter n=1 Tax=Serratia microhaemolytica TaxID=2675110 RepID=UPI000FDCF83C|nr:nickel/cobalt transporter [Serratia microhaemolytica]
MSVKRPEVNHQRNWLLNLWPLVLFLILLLVGGIAIWYYWPQLLMQSTAWQKSLQQEMAVLLQQVKAAPQQAGLTLLLFSLGYGVLHALGPGHGKIVISAYLATHPTRLKNSIQLTLLAALAQGVVAIGLVLLVLVVLQLSSSRLHQSTFWLEQGSFVLLMLLGALLSLRAAKRLYLVVKAMRPGSALQIHQLQPLPADHVHSDHCGCGHQHLPNEAQLQAGDDWRTKAAIVLAMGMRPCSGAIMVLIFAKVIDVFAWGIFSAFAMAIGTALTLSCLALLVYYSRDLAIRLSARRTPAAWRAVAWWAVAFTGGMILLIAGLLLYTSAQPGLGGGVRLFLR